MQQNSQKNIQMVFFWENLHIFFFKSTPSWVNNYCIRFQSKFDEITSLVLDGLDTKVIQGQFEQFSQLHDGIFRRDDSVADGPRVFKELLVIAAFAGTIAEEVDLVETIFLDMLQAKPFVPPRWINVNGDLTTDGKGQARVRKLLHEGQAKFLPEADVEPSLSQICNVLLLWYFNF